MVTNTHREGFCATDLEGVPPEDPIYLNTAGSEKRCNRLPYGIHKITFEVTLWTSEVTKSRAFGLGTTSKFDLLVVEASPPGSSKSDENNLVHKTTSTK
ncbi:hypothetical protein RUM43_003636 [Polyplax serrata]|uniref:Uncharacterized protein n=1 Tax=Polyplax serrata TaxID=468196 RepID=A0AAN8PHK4_POLSC